MLLLKIPPEDCATRHQWWIHLPLDRRHRSLDISLKRWGTRQAQEEIFDRETRGTATFTKVTQWNVKTARHYLSFTHLCPFFPLPSRIRVQASACVPIVFIKARCHGIVTAVRLISVLTVRRCQPRRSRTLAAKCRVPLQCILTRQNDTGAFLFRYLTIRFRSHGRSSDGLFFQPDKSDSMRNFISR